MAYRVLGEGVEQQCRQRRTQSLVLESDVQREPVRETDTLDLEVAFQHERFLLECNGHAARAIERVAQQLRKAPDHR